MISPSPSSLKEADLIQWLGAHEVAKGRGYLTAVTQLHSTPGMVTALVRGSRSQPYAVRINLAQSKRGGRLANQCTCPVGVSCKHVAATLLCVMAQSEGEPLNPNPAVINWLRDFRQQRQALDTPAAAKKRKTQSEQLFYFIDCYPESGRTLVSMRKARLRADGSQPDNAADWSNIERALLQPPAFVDDNDLAILRQLWLVRDRDSGYYGQFDLAGKPVGDLIARMLATGRCLFSDAKWIPLAAGEAQQGVLGWRLDDKGLQRPVVQAAGRALMVMACNPPWYIEPGQGLCGPLQIALDAPTLFNLLRMPPLRPVDAGLVGEALAEVLPALARPQVDAAAQVPEYRQPLRAVLELITRPSWFASSWRGYPRGKDAVLDLALPRFHYGELMFRTDSVAEFHSIGGRTHRIVRDLAAEAAALAALAAQGFQTLRGTSTYLYLTPEASHWLGLESEAAWSAWAPRIAPALRAAGWALDMAMDFRHNVLELDEIFAEVDEGEPGWFDVSLGIEVEGERVALAPLLASFLRRHPQWSTGKGLAKLPDKQAIELELDEGLRVRIKAARIKPVLSALIDLLDGDANTLRVQKLDAPRLEALAASTDMRGREAVEAACKRLRAAQGVKAIKSPKGLGLALRPYQLEGLAWLQHLREHDLAGILADDMGLGKTAQTLAHLLLEKQAGRMDRPSLIVLPTSLVFNWRREAERIAPKLSLHILHGPQRDFSRIAGHDIVLTTYPLVWRDADELKKHAWHLLILDEAQTVKNAASKAAATLRTLDARHRLCLTGTPMENHLGELWSQFDFLLPGFLGDNKDFTRRWRSPIEKGGDSLRRELLSQRIKPFILRRRKDEVAKELPPKNIVLRTVSLEGGQRDLYETVRAVMDEKVRNEIASKGFKRSQIVILDALLKLRQVCCDPRLLPLKSAEKVKERAKLDLFMEMLPELVEEGRRVLVFSQFTSMLDLIVAELDKAKIAHVLLTGQTKDRATPVQRFQDGEVPVFLISLKAGGVGLNLTAADTVIHFDPWWNPAAEDQATDRAHRIGQTKTVFVYKLIAEGSIEERILALQDKKASLARAVLGGDAEGDIKFSESDLANLLAPLPDIESPAPKRGPGRPRKAV